MKVKNKLIWGIAAFLLVVCIATFVYLNDCYRADTDAVAVFAADSAVFERQLSDDALLISQENADTGFIFYPGGKVEHTAYVPLMRACAAEGIACVLLEMPFNLAVFDINAADGIQTALPEIKNWYIGGHSLGGAMAAAYLADNTESFDGLVLLAAYSTADISAAPAHVLSIYGSEDGVMDREKYEGNMINMPADFSELIIDGGNHAGFGMYGEQEGDGEARITNDEQIAITAKAVAEFVK